MTIQDGCDIAIAIFAGLGYLKSSKAAKLGHENKVTIERVETQTNGMRTQMEATANKEGRAEGKAQEKLDQADRESNGK